MITKAEWEQVLSEYMAPSEEIGLLCYRSKTFAKMWKDGCRFMLIIQKAKQFLKEGKFPVDEIRVGGLADHLFFCRDGSPETFESIRTKFLQWCVK